MKIILLIGLFLFLWAFLIEPSLIVVKKYKINNPDLKGCRLVFFSDIHITPWQKGRLKRIVDKINSFAPDLVLSTGDFVSGYLPSKTLPIEQISSELKNINSKYGIYIAVLKVFFYLL